MSRATASGSGSRWRAPYSRTPRCWCSLDEPTANLDTVTERELLASVWETTRDRAVLLITHRLVGMEEMDEILVMDTGRVVERGTHEELTRSGGLYIRMLETQRELLAEPRAS